MKKTALLLILITFCASLALAENDGPRVWLGNSPNANYGNGEFKDGDEVTVSWDFGRIPSPTTIAEITIASPLGFGYNLAVGARNLPTGSMTFRPRVFRISGEEYFIRVVWRDQRNPFNMPPIAIAVSKSFRIKLLGGERSIRLLRFDDDVRGTNWIRWESRNLPPNAQILLTYRDINGRSDVANTPIEMVSDTGGYLWSVPSSLPRGRYVVEIFYVTEYGVFGAENQSNVFLIGN